MIYEEGEQVMNAIAVIANDNLSGVDLDNAIGIISIMISNLQAAQKIGWK